MYKYYYYSTKDSYIAFRIYYSLINAGLDVFLYERKGEKGMNFISQIHKNICESKYFCLIDSSNARSAPYVREECDYATKIMNNGNPNGLAIIPCFVEDIDRTKSNWFYENQLFPEQEKISGLKFYGIDRVDYLEVYYNGINELCSLCKATYKPWADYPSGEDFENELESLRVKDTPTTDEGRTFLKTDYANFIYSTLKGSPTSLDRINTLIKDCTLFYNDVFICYIAKAQILADSNQDDEALKVFNYLSKKFPEDPRGWYAMSAAQFYTYDLEGSLSSINKALQLLEKYKKSKNSSDHKPEVLLNKFQLLLAMEEYQEARNLLDDFSNILMDLPQKLIAELKLELLEGRIFNNDDERYSRLKNSYSVDLNKKFKDENLNRLIGDLEFNIGMFYFKSGQLNEVLNHIDFALIFAPTNIFYHAEFNFVKVLTNKSCVQSIQEALQLSPITDEDYYYYGLLKYLSYIVTGSKIDFEVSNHFYLKSNKTDWGFYDSHFKF